MYSLFMLLAAVAVGAQVQAIRRGRTVDWVALRRGHRAAAVDAVLRPAADRSSSRSAFGWVIWRARRRPGRWKSLLRGWALAALIVVLVALPMLPILRRQLEAYGNRGAGLVPGQAGAGSSAIGGNDLDLRRRRQPDLGTCSATTPTARWCRSPPSGRC